MFTLEILLEQLKIERDFVASKAEEQSDLNQYHMGRLLVLDNVITQLEVLTQEVK